MAGFIQELQRKFDSPRVLFMGGKQRLIELSLGGAFQGELLSLHFSYLIVKDCFHIQCANIFQYERNTKMNFYFYKFTVRLHYCS